MDDLMAFLKARLDEDEAVAQAAPRGPWAEDESHSVVDATGARVIYSVNGGTLHPTPAVRAHVLGHDPARVLREVEAKRQILDEHGDVNDGSCDTCVDGQWGYPIHGGSSPQRYPCRTLRLLAAVYADHPDYRPAWSPTA